MIKYKKILVAGMRRSGSTLLFNIIRLIYLLNNKTVYSKWFRYFDKKEAENYDVNIIKIHDFMKVYLNKVDIILTTRRDIRDMVASNLERINDEEKFLGDLKIAKKNINRYNNWKLHSDYEFVYEDYLKNKEKSINKILNFFEIDVNKKELYKYIEEIKNCKGKYLKDSNMINNPHSGIGIGGYKKVLSKNQIEKITNNHKEWLIKYNYL